MNRVAIKTEPEEEEEFEVPPPPSPNEYDQDQDQQEPIPILNNRDNNNSIHDYDVPPRPPVKMEKTVNNSISDNHPVSCSTENTASSQNVIANPTVSSRLSPIISSEKRFYVRKVLQCKFCSNYIPRIKALALQHLQSCQQNQKHQELVADQIPIKIEPRTTPRKRKRVKQRYYSSDSSDS